MSEAKTNNNTAVVANQSKEFQPTKPYRPYLEEYRSVISGKKEILNTKKLNALCEYIFKCAQTCDGTMHVYEYLRAPEAPFNVGVRTYENWLHKYPELEEADNELKEAIGNKLRGKVLKYEIAPTLIHKDLNMYCERYKKYFEWEQSLKNKNDDGSKKYVLIMEQTKDCPEVPKLETDESND